MANRAERPEDLIRFRNHIESLHEAINEGSKAYVWTRLADWPTGDALCIESRIYWKSEEKQVIQVSPEQEFEAAAARVTTQMGREAEARKRFEAEADKQGLTGGQKDRFVAEAVERLQGALEGEEDGPFQVLGR